MSNAMTMMLKFPKRSQEVRNTYNVHFLLWEVIVRYQTSETNEEVTLDVISAVKPFRVHIMPPYSIEDSQVTEL